MTENADDAAAASARAAEQARLRKERREAKIKAGGASRLNRITGLGGGVQPDPVPAAPSPAATPAAATPTPHAHGDPEEVDISEHFYQPERTNRVPTPVGGEMSEAQLRQMMLGFEGGGMPGMEGLGGMPGMGMPGMGMPGMGMPGMGMPGMGGDAEDPMMKMLSQMMGGAGGNPFGPGGMPNPFAAGGPGGENPFAGMMPGAQQTAVIPDRYSAIWRLLHTAVALGLGLYIALMTGFAGTKIERTAGQLEGYGVTRGTAEDGKVFDYTRFFWLFATAEAILLSTRYFFDRARAPPGGMIWSLVGFLPQPWKGYVEIAMRYARIFGTVRSDILVCVFVLGVCSWLRA